MYTLILAGGSGTRLRSIVNDVPKPMAPVCNMPFLEYVLANLKSVGLQKFIFLLHYKADYIQNYFSDGSKWDVEIIYSVEKEPLGTGGAISLLRERLDKTFCLVNADTLLTINFNKLTYIHYKQKPILTIALAKVNDPARFGEVLLDENNYVTSFKEKNCLKLITDSINEHYINAGFYMIEPQILKYIPENIPISLEKEVFPILLGHKEKILGFNDVKQFFDIGTPQDYIVFQKWIKDNPCYFFNYPNK